jgi:hypothetical protein
LLTRTSSRCGATPPLTESRLRGWARGTIGELAVVVGLPANQRGALYNNSDVLRAAGITLQSRGHELSRYMVAWRDASVAQLLGRLGLPPTVVEGEVLPRVRALYAAETAAHQLRRGRGRWHRRRVATCDGCGTSSDETEILVSVHMHGRYCDQCIDTDDELSGHKWEPLD